MAISTSPNNEQSDFYVEKWFLDCISHTGETMIFYVANLRWHRWEVPYTSWLWYDPGSGTKRRSRFHHVHLPDQEGNIINWVDPRFGIRGRWESRADILTARLFESSEGYLDWNCYQPISKVRLKAGDRQLECTGYAEQLILSIAPWKIPMEELRWGRYGHQKDYMVWIDIRGERNQTWLWYNGEKIDHVAITDNLIQLPSRNLILTMKNPIPLEAEKKIFKIATKLTHLPGLRHSMPLHFLMADGAKWRSRGLLHQGNQLLNSGWIIHEYINFRPPPA